MTRNSKNTKAAKKTANVHLPRARSAMQYFTRSGSATSKSLTGRIVLVVIALASVCVVIALIAASLYNPERQTEQKITAIAKDYYETYFYPEITSEKPTDNLESIFSRYADAGFADVSLRQLLLFDSGRHRAEASFLTTYCDENATLVRFFPIPPYGQHDYHAEIVYSCNFKK